MKLRARLRKWQLHLGLSRESNPHAYSGPSAEDLARERSYRASRTDPTAQSVGEEE